MSPGAATQKQRAPIACVHCRNSKARCEPAKHTGGRCKRCIERNKECRYLSVNEQHELEKAKSAYRRHPDVHGSCSNIADVSAYKLYTFDDPLLKQYTYTSATPSPGYPIAYLPSKDDKSYCNAPEPWTNTNYGYHDGSLAISDSVDPLYASYTHDYSRDVRSLSSFGSMAGGQYPAARPLPKTDGDSPSHQAPPSPVYNHHSVRPNVPYDHTFRSPYTKESNSCHE
ncbi:hypothetical protein FISHEDRAFT_75456 [Fistulina hepatica ATCC 64428]|uniref:Zn(2)-C6 fungal-type domain-containing protein n=1 Tax=Fistulina hepatica ATCC 64428 TaxID=1128425 RepID=A0A0D7A7C0_9AGAR|nr:hypothetical protein FISHEDRAFT_75456 [Fistulina hepatica ATCC 64428]